MDIELSEFCHDCGAWMDPFQADFFGYWDDLRRDLEPGLPTSMISLPPTSRRTNARQL
jgi:hypothetical protein